MRRKGLGLFYCLGAEFGVAWLPCGAVPHNPGYTRSKQKCGFELTARVEKKMSARLGVRARPCGKSSPSRAG